MAVGSTARRIDDATYEECEVTHTRQNFCNPPVEPATAASANITAKSTRSDRAVANRQKSKLSCLKFITADETEMPRSTAFQSERSCRRSPRTAQSLPDG
jgi:hypothetical protein